VNKPLDPATESRPSTSTPPKLVDSPTRPRAAPDEFEQSTTRFFDPIDNFIVDAIRWNKLLVAVVAVLGALVGTAVGLLRQPTYQASTTLQVGQVNPSSAGFGNYTESVSALAAVYSRDITASPVLAEIQRKLGLTAAESGSRLSSEPIPASPIFKVVATGSSSRAAIELANDAAAAVGSYAATGNSSSSTTKPLLVAYTAAVRATRRAFARENRLSHSAPTSAQILAQIAANTAAAKRDALLNSYRTAVQDQVSRGGLVSVLASANSATSDRKAKTELFAFLGLLFGFVLGSAVAVWRERRPRVDDPSSS
jgi:capsular polysaccharide biosynthesis protein